MSSSNERASWYQRAIYPVSAATGAKMPPASGVQAGKSAYSRWAIIISVPISSSDFERSQADAFAMVCPARSELVSAWL